FGVIGGFAGGKRLISRLVSRQPGGTSGAGKPALSSPCHDNPNLHPLVRRTRRKPRSGSFSEPMKHTFVLTALSALGLISASAAEPSLVHLANPLQGTDSVGDFSHGNTFPAIALPFPMNVWAPYTQPAKDSFYYQYRQNKIRGIRQTHQPSPWIADYANFSLMAVSGKLAVKEDDRASEYRHEEIGRAHV